MFILAMVGSLIHSRSRVSDASWFAFIVAATFSRPGSSGAAFAAAAPHSAATATTVRNAFMSSPFDDKSRRTLDWQEALVQTPAMRYFLDTEYNGWGGALL